MSTFLFNEIIFGPVISRRLGNSLGINLLPVSKKVCNFNCLYCECGLNQDQKGASGLLPKRFEVREMLKKALNSSVQIDTITFAGNGEPTMHPAFEEIVDDTLSLRDEFRPNAKIAVLSNATLIDKKKVRRALNKIDYNILKLDSAKEETIKLLNCPQGNFSLEKLVNSLKNFDNLTIQTMFLRGEYDGKPFDNTTEEEINLWLNMIRVLNPQQVMIYTIARDTPVSNLEKISISKLNEIASRVKNRGIPVMVSA